MYSMTLIFVFLALSFSHINIKCHVFLGYPNESKHRSLEAIGTQKGEQQHCLLPVHSDLCERNSQSCYFSLHHNDIVQCLLALAQCVMHQCLRAYCALLLPSLQRTTNCISLNYQIKTLCAAVPPQGLQHFYVIILLLSPSSHAL